MWKCIVYKVIAVSCKISWCSPDWSASLDAVPLFQFFQFYPFWPLTPDNYKAFSSTPTAAHCMFCSVWTPFCKHYTTTIWLVDSLSINMSQTEWLHHLNRFLICVCFNCCYTGKQTPTTMWWAQLLQTHKINVALWRRQALKASGFGISAVHYVCIWWCLLSWEAGQLVG